MPTSWKKQKFILIQKTGKSLDEPQSYRPICLLDSLGKCLGQIVYNRILWEVEEVYGISEMLFGFRKASSTVDVINLVVNAVKWMVIQRNWKYCTIVSLDMMNALTVWALYNLIVPKISNPDRTLWYETDIGTESIQRDWSWVLYYKTSCRTVVLNSMYQRK